MGASNDLRTSSVACGKALEISISGFPDFRTGYESHMDMMLLAFTDRLTTERWHRRCEFTASESFEKASTEGQRIILLFLHQGPIQLLPYWIRSFGVRASMIIARNSSSRLPHQQWRDERVLFPDQKVVWHRNELKGFIKLLDKGGTLLMAVDTDFGKQSVSRLKDGSVFRFASGPIRLGEKHGCTIFPCGLESLGNWRFRLRIGHQDSGTNSELVDDLMDCYDRTNLSSQMGDRLSKA